MTIACAAINPRSAAAIRIKQREKTTTGVVTRDADRRARDVRRAPRGRGSVVAVVSMALPFRRSLRSLRTDSHRGAIAGGVVALALLAAWAAWAGLARVPLVETSATARLETIDPVHRVEAPIDGRVVEILVALGDEVAPGDVLVRLESEAQRLELAEAEARRRALEAQLGPLRAELAAASTRIERGASTARGAVSEASARSRAAAAQAELAHDRSRRVAQLAPQGGVSEEQRATASAEAARTASEAEAATLAIQRLRWEHLVQESDARLRVEAVRRELARVEGEIEAASAAATRLARELDRRAITAPVAGRVAHLEPLSAGRFVAAGALLLSLLPEGELVIVAHFEPGRAFGRLRSEQLARMRLDGFPWTRFGMLDARVRRVADEPSDRGVRVELALVDRAAFPAPLEHGLPGRVEVVVEEVSPAELLVRAAGGWLAP
ncbi:MAG: HlyD family efflux transporter periplasmic adaptor subunit [Sandaracinaceae bacterium]|nr:HlyD family efflux transporter periplasmic adaptor subunit [Sandaracinaceae bacterium]